MAQLAQGAAVDAYKRLMAVSEKIRLTGLDAEDVANIYLAAACNMILETSWGDNVVGFLRDAAEQYDNQIAESFRELHLRFEEDRL